MRTITFTSKQVSRGCAEFGPSSLVYTDVVCEDGTVTTTVKGECDGEYINQSKTRNVGRTLDLDVVTAARVRDGWVPSTDPKVLAGRRAMLREKGCAR